VANEHGPALWVEIVLCEREGLMDAQPAAPEHHDHGAQPPPVRVIAHVTHHADDLLDGRRIRWVAHPLIAGRTPGVKARERRGRTTPPSRIEHE
jgi:hypothetical protein